MVIVAAKSKSVSGITAGVGAGAGAGFGAGAGAGAGAGVGTSLAHPGTIKPITTTNVTTIIHILLFILTPFGKLPPYRLSKNLFYQS